MGQNNAPMGTSNKLKSKIKMATTPVKVTTQNGTSTFVQDFESTQPVSDEVIKNAIVAALDHLGIKPKR